MDRAPNIESTSPAPLPVVDLEHARKAFACEDTNERGNVHDAHLWADCALTELLAEVKAWRAQGAARTAQQEQNVRALVAAAQDAVNALTVLSHAAVEPSRARPAAANLINLKRALLPFSKLLLAVLLAVGAAISGGCGSSPASPSPAVLEAPRSVQALDGWSGEALSASVVASGAAISVRAGGYLPRVQVAAPSVFLWPQAESYVSGLVYGQHSPNARLARWRRGFVLPPVEGVDVQALAREVAAATGLDVGVGASTEARVVVEPDDPVFAKYPAAMAAAYLDFRGSEVVGCRLVFRAYVTEEWLAHEVGHCLGLGHSLAPGDLMQPGGGSAPRFSPAERVALRMMYLRREPGNALPDTAPGVTSAGVARSRIAVVEGGRP